MNNLLLPDLHTIRLPLRHDVFETLSMLRLDTVCPVMSGNKLYKLLPNIRHAQQQGCDTLLSFGGAFSNHLAALASAGQAYGLKTVAIVRGEATAASNSTLSAAINRGMHCHFVDRKTYQRRYDAEFLVEWQQRYPSALIIPEGGSNELARQGCAELGRLVALHYPNIRHFIIPVGTGTTALGFSEGIGAAARVFGVPVLNFQQDLNGINLIQNYHHGGYAKLSQSLIQFMSQFEKLNNILLDPVYTAKMAFAAADIIQQYDLDPSTVALVHTGGIQGREGMMPRMRRLGYVDPACT